MCQARARAFILSSRGRPLTCAGNHLDIPPLRRYFWAVFRDKEKKGAGVRMGTKILVADDSKTIQTAIQLTFSGENVELIAARSGEEAIQKAKEVLPDLMLIDAAMPDKNGYEVCQTLKADPRMKEVPVIMMIGPFEAVTGSAGQTVGAAGFISKPFEAQVLIAKVKQLLDAQPVPHPAPPEPELEIAAVGAEPLKLYLVETAPIVLEEERDAGGSLTPPVTPPILSLQESLPTLLEEAPVVTARQTVELSAEVLQPLVEQAARGVAEQVATQVAKDVTEVLVTRIEQIIREIVPALAETLIAKEIERIKSLVEDKTVE